ncbi:MAG: bifunctional UDP-sugar hydrolase/5'-nucleotidase [Chitinophagales bacterium]
MKNPIFLLSLIAFLFTFNSCDSTKKTIKTPTTDIPAMEDVDDGIIEVVFLQMNDVYEIAPLEGGKVGGLARVATVREQLLKENPLVVTILAGDFLNPSLIGTLKHEGERIKGKHIVETMNAMKVDLVTVGNHEFDLKEDELQARINESKFEWVVANVLQKDSIGNLSPFAKTINGTSYDFPETYQLNLTDEDGTNVSIGILSVCLDSNKKPYVHYNDVFDSAIQAYGEMKDETDYVVGLTHLNIEDDLELAKKLPKLPLIMGGHDHHHMYHEVGEVKVAKADANAKTVYVHRLTFNKKMGSIKVNSELVEINDKIAEDPIVDAVVDKWNGIAEKSMKDAGFDPEKTITTLKEPLDGREKVMRNGPTNMGEVITKSILKAAPKSVAAFMNSGSVRLDDFLSGSITEVDIIRTLPFGGGIVEADMSGELLHEILVVGRENKGSGGYLQLQKIEYVEAEDIWKIDGKTLNPTATYRIAFTDFLLTGLEKDLDFLTRDNPDIFKIYEPKKGDKEDLRSDIRRAIIDYLVK